MIKIKKDGIDVRVVKYVSQTLRADRVAQNMQKSLISFRILMGILDDRLLGLVVLPSCLVELSAELNG